MSKLVPCSYHRLNCLSNSPINSTFLASCDMRSSLSVFPAVLWSCDRDIPIRALHTHCWSPDEWPLTSERVIAMQDVPGCCGCGQFSAGRFTKLAAWYDILLPCENWRPRYPAVIDGFLFRQRIEEKNLFPFSGYKSELGSELFRLSLNGIILVIGAAPIIVHCLLCRKRVIW